MIIASAILHNGIVFTGFRHSEIIHYLIQLGYEKPILNNEQGFIDHDGTFMYRDRARSHAKVYNQISKDFNKVLTSEDLW